MTEKMTTPGIGVSPTSNGHRAALDLKSNVLEGARGLSDEMKNLAGDVAGEAKKTAESGLAAGKKRATEGMASVANAIRKTGEHLRAEDQGGFTEYFDRAARQVDVASDYLQSRTIGDVIGDVEQFARREPALFLGGSFVAGLLGGRFLKSSRPAPAGRIAGPTGRPNPNEARGTRRTENPRGEDTRRARGAEHEPQSQPKAAMKAQDPSTAANRPAENRSTTATKGAEGPSANKPGAT
jgi:hypothetical protein